MWKSGELPELSRIPRGGVAYSNNYSSPCFRPVFPWVPDSTSIWIPNRHGKVSIACSDSSCLFPLLSRHQAVSPNVQHCGKGEQLTSSTDPKPWGSSSILLFLSYPTLNYQPITWAHNPFAYRISSAFQVFEFRSLFTTFVVTAGVHLPSPHTWVLPECLHWSPHLPPLKLPILQPWSLWFIPTCEMAF